MIVKQEKCKSPEHNPPPLMVYPLGEHVWKCPECGQEQRVLVLEPLLVDEVFNEYEHYVQI